MTLTRADRVFALFSGAVLGAWSIPLFPTVPAALFMLVALFGVISHLDEIAAWIGRGPAERERPEAPDLDDNESGGAV